MKNSLILLFLCFMVGCSNINSKTETKDEQITRLLELADKREEEEKLQESKQLEVTIKNENEISEEETLEVVTGEESLNNSEEIINTTKTSKKFDPRHPHIGKTRGEIMQYEMERINQKMNVIEEEVNSYIETGNILNEQKQKLENLNRINKVSM